MNYTLTSNLVPGPTQSLSITLFTLVVLSFLTFVFVSTLPTIILFARKIGFAQELFPTADELVGLSSIVYSGTQVATFTVARRLPLLLTLSMAPIVAVFFLSNKGTVDTSLQLLISVFFSIFVVVLSFRDLKVSLTNSLTDQKRDVPDSVLFVRYIHSFYVTIVLGLLTVFLVLLLFFILTQFARDWITLSAETFALIVPSILIFIAFLSLQAINLFHSKRVEPKLKTRRVGTNEFLPKAPQFLRKISRLSKQENQSGSVALKSYDFGRIGSMAEISNFEFVNSSLSDVEILIERSFKDQWKQALNDISYMLTGSFHLFVIVMISIATLSRDVILASFKDFLGLVPSSFHLIRLIMESLAVLLPVLIVVYAVVFTGRRLEQEYFFSNIGQPKSRRERLWRSGALVTRSRAKDASGLSFGFPYISICTAVLYLGFLIFLQNGVVSVFDLNLEFNALVAGALMFATIVWVRTLPPSNEGAIDPSENLLSLIVGSCLLLLPPVVLVFSSQLTHEVVGTCCALFFLIEVFARRK